MKTSFDVIEDYLSASRVGYDLDESTVRAVTEGVWYADRKERKPGGLRDIHNGIWWTHSGSHVVSLAHGTDLHGWHGYDWETYVFKGEPNETVDVCCHDSFDAAEKCALTFIRSGHWCGANE